jgi:hypothetical protein
LQNKQVIETKSEAHTERRRPQHDCLPSLLGYGDKGIEIVYSEGKYFALGQLERPRQNKNLLYWQDNPNEPTKEEPLSFVLFESPITSVSTVSRGHPFLVSLGLSYL